MKMRALILCFASLLVSGLPSAQAQWSQHHYVETSLRMYRTPEWKLVRDFLNSGKDELYHLKVDPDENKNLINDPSAREIRRKLEAKMIERMRANNDPALKAEKTAKREGQ